MKNKITKEQVEQIKTFIDEQLRIRCINVETKLEVAQRRGEDVLELSSTKFNTVPVIHSEIEICDFGSSILNSDEKIVWVDKEETKEKILNRTRIYIAVHASYEGNGVELFRVHGIINEGNDSIFLSTTRISN